MGIKAESKSAESATTPETQAKVSKQKTAPTRKTKKAQLAALLQRKGGASVGALEKHFGWQPHTIRAAISGLRKAGSTVERSAGKSGAVYRIVEPAPSQ